MCLFCGKVISYKQMQKRLHLIFFQWSMHLFSDNGGSINSTCAFPVAPGTGTWIPSVVEFQFSEPKRALQPSDSWDNGGSINSTCAFPVGAGHRALHTLSCGVPLLRDHFSQRQAKLELVKIWKPDVLSITPFCQIPVIGWKSGTL